MTYNEFLDQVINLGIEAAKEDYKDRADHKEGAIAGFEACRGKEPIDLLDILNEVKFYASKFSHYNEVQTFWWYRCYQCEVEWVINCVSCLLVNQGQPPLLLGFPTCNAMMLVSKIVGTTDSPIK